MHDLYELKDVLLKELKEYGKKGEMSAGSLDVVDKLSHTIKNLCKIIDDMEDEQYSTDGGMMNRPYRNSYGERDRSYARGRGRNARRDAMGRYSSDGYSQTGEMVQELRELMQDAPDDRTRQEFQRFIQKIEQM